VPFLSADKVLVILVVALVVLGPNKLPQVARQLGSLWADFQRFRQRVETEVRSTFPDLPSTEVLTRAVRSPLSVLDELSTTGDAPAAAPGPAVGGAVGGAVGDDRPGAGEAGRLEESGRAVADPWWARSANGARTDGPPAPAGPGNGSPGVRHAIRETRPLFLDDPSMN
jgi:Sec-independent protein translocase protein TatA